MVDGIAPYIAIMGSAFGLACTDDTGADRTTTSDDVSGAGYEDSHDDGLENSMREDPGFPNSNSRQSQCD